LARPAVPAATVGVALTASSIVNGVSVNVALTFLLATI